MTNCIGIVYTKNDNELSLSNRVWYVTKARQDNDVIDHIGLIDAETELNGQDLSNWVCTICDQNQIE